MVPASLRNALKPRRQSQRPVGRGADLAGAGIAIVGALIIIAFGESEVAPDLESGRVVFEESASPSQRPFRVGPV